MGKEESSEQGAVSVPKIVTLKEQVQALFDQGAEFPYGQPYDPPAPPKGRPVTFASVQPTLRAQAVEHVHDGGAWIGIKLRGGITCRTKHAAELRRLAEDPSLLRVSMDKKIHLEDVGRVTT